MLCFLLQINVMHLKHECQFSLGRRTVATVNASNVGSLKTGLQHTGHMSPTGFLRTHRPNIAYVQYVGDRSTQRPNRGGEMLAQAMHEGLYSWPPGTEGRGPPSEARLLVCTPTNGGGNTHRADSTVPSSPSLTSSFSLLPSYCVGGSANRKVRVSERGEGKKTARENNSIL